MKLHPLSVAYRTGTAVSRFVWVLVIGVISTSRLDGLNTGAAALLTAAILAVLAYQLAYVRRFEYTLTADTFDLRSGVVSRRTREIPYRRVQNVDVSRNVLQRAIGIAELRIETAGGGETEAQLRYVSDDEATRIQREIGRLKRGETGDRSETASGAAPDSEPAHATELFAITPRELLLLGVVRVDLRLLSFATVLLPVVLPSVSETFPLLDLFRAAPIVLGGLVAAALVVSSATAVANYYGFELHRGPDELRYRRGLIQEYSGTIPLDKVQSVSVTENALARRLGYASLEVETAGYAPGGNGQGSQSAVPLARRKRVLDLARSVEQFGDPTFRRPPVRARSRYAVRYALVVAFLTAVSVTVVRFTAIEPPVPALSPLVLLAAVPPAAHLKWVNLGYALTGDHFVAREGFWTRTTRVVPYYRIQTLAESSTPFQRRRDLATLVVDTAGAQGLGTTDARALDVDADRANELRVELERQFQTALGERRAEIAAKTRSRESWSSGVTPGDD